MRAKMRAGTKAALVVALACAMGLPAGSGVRRLSAQQMGQDGQTGQDGQQTPGQLPQQPPEIGPSRKPFGAGPDDIDAKDPMQARMRQEAIQQANLDRHKKMEADAATLVELSAELKAAVDKTGNDQMSLDVIRKAEEIEKLAHDVKERMKG